ncbi:CYS3 (YAL012W) [Zygosaccharomyces parabailii]|uniref:cystathionine gamma-lyase n=1 Tax=Zygosaccharomyces bailii (strain CLIB 213 / ATCC 58445 / CBS 680 / BCRC 21525 / NBRC 1098 / NCYC 1416 / NRRL Y-2227) TaxID=1333698 RepID=A0A8J2X2L9_ZYGB2|nr:CYS3 (YAL012W) [Zygosaccharomyces parabailii]CDF90561.1 ZYBA0S07-03862g1_1 [Zygosaccharomyces bailii CLIB 213]SJM84168.1 probable Cystathionine gamma-lyase [Zygosaccharomyces bailii]
MVLRSTDKFATKAIHAGAHIDIHGSVIEPISLSTTFKQSAPAQPLGEYEYSRSQNPNRKNLEEAIASLENAKHGLAFSSGSATTAVVLQSLPQGSHAVSIGDVYGGTHRYFTKVANAHGVDTTFTNDLLKELPSLIKANTKLVWIESPTNPTLKVTDIELVNKTVKKINKDILVVVDNTFLSPYLSNPLNFGVDLVVHSATKYINGHSDVVLGVLATNNTELYERLQFLQNAIGAIPSPFDSWLVHRGLKTLHLRVRQAALTATKIAEYLEKSNQVVAVNYPGLESHPDRAVVVKQHRDGLGGGMISFRIKGGAEAAAKFSSSTRLFTLAESLGGVESLLEVPAVMTHGGIPKEQREASGVYDDLIRLSVGIEDTEDLLQDVEEALKAAAQ